MKRSNWALVWEEEKDALGMFASRVPKNGIIVEVGTAFGGTAAIFYNAAKNKNIRIFTVDISPSRQAIRNLKNTDIRIIKASSKDYAQVWSRKVGKPIDVLYIDGDHNFLSVFEDFNNWVPFVKPGATVVFHDYDLVNRGGLIHFAVRVCVETITSRTLLSATRHEYKLFSGIKNEKTRLLRLQDCFRTFVDIGRGINEVRKKIFAQSIQRGLCILQDKKTNFTSLDACYCVDFALKRDPSLVLEAAHSPNDCRRWVETLCILEHAVGQSRFPEDIHKILIPKKGIDLSRLIANEQVRITLLASILKTIVSWEP